MVSNVNYIKVKRVSGKGDRWATEALIDMYHGEIGGSPVSDSYIVQGLVLSPSEREHSVAPKKIKITYEDGSWHEYSLAECYACGRGLPGGGLSE